MLDHPLLRLLAALAAVSVLADAAPAFAGDDSGTAEFRSIADMSGLAGVWRSRGYGWVWVVKGGRLRVYEESGSYCIKSKDDIDKYIGGARFSDDERSFRISFDDPAYEYVFDRIPTPIAEDEIKRPAIAAASKGRVQRRSPCCAGRRSAWRPQ